jgi:hypothetical protein
MTRLGDCNGDGALELVAARGYGYGGRRRQRAANEELATANLVKGTATEGARWGSCELGRAMPTGAADGGWRPFRWQAGSGGGQRGNVSEPPCEGVELEDGRRGGLRLRGTSDDGRRRSAPMNRYISILVFLFFS